MKKATKTHAGSALETAFEHIATPVMVFDATLQSVIAMNKQARAVFGEILIPREFCEKISTSEKRQFEKAIQNCTEDEKSRSSRLVIGKQRWKAQCSSFDGGVVVTFEKIKPPVSLKSKLLAGFVNSMGDSALITDEHSNIVGANKAICDGLNISPASLRDLSTADLGGDISQGKIQQFRASSASGPVMFDMKVTSPDGSVLDYEVNLFEMTVNKKKYYGSVSRDITEFKQAQLELERSNKRFESIATATMEALWEVDIVTNIRWANEVHQKLYGLTRHDPVPPGAAWQERIHPSVRTKVIASLQDAVNRRKDKWITEYWFCTPTGAYIYIYDRTLLMYDEEGNLKRMMGSMVDLTELKNMQEELSIQKNLSEGIINSLPGVFYLLDREGRFLRWNKNFEKITGYSAEEIKMHPADKFVYKNEAHILHTKVKEVFQKGQAEMEATLVDKNGVGRPFYLSGWRTTIDNEECLIGTGMDITEMKKAQESVKRMELKITEQRIQEQKTISRAIINAQEKERNHIARELHDNVNQLLAGARLYLTMGAKKSDELSELMKYPLELLDTGIQEIRYLTHKNITPSNNPDLEQLLEGLKTMLLAASIDCTLRYNLTEQLEENLLINVYRILQEQVNNIMRHSKAKNVLIEISSHHNDLHIHTQDDGIGFDVHKLREGIGIYNLYSRVEAYNGIIGIQSEPGKGCTIDIKIPAFNGVAEERAHGREAAREKRRASNLLS